MATKPAPVEDNFELKASKAMGVMEEGDAVFGSGAEVNLDSQVLCHFSLSICFLPGLFILLHFSTVISIHASKKHAGLLVA